MEKIECDRVGANGGRCEWWTREIAVGELGDGRPNNASQCAARYGAEITSGWVDELWEERVNLVVGPQLIGRTRGVGRLATTVTPKSQFVVDRPVPNHISLDLQIGVTLAGARDVRVRCGSPWSGDVEVLPRTLDTGRVVDDVVENEDVAIGDGFTVAVQGGRAPPATGQIGTTTGSRTAIAVTRTKSERDLDEMATCADVVEGVVGEENVVATIDPHTSSSGVMYKIIHKAYVVGFVVQPRCGHVLEAGALPGHKTASAAVVDFIGLNANSGRPTLDVEAPILRIVNGVADDMSVLHCHKINTIVVGSTDGAVFDVDVLGLIDF